MSHNLKVAKYLTEYIVWPQIMPHTGEKMEATIIPCPWGHRFYLDKYNDVRKIPKEVSLRTCAQEKKKEKKKKTNVLGMRHTPVSQPVRGCGSIA